MELNYKKVHDQRLNDIIAAYRVVGSMALMTCSIDVVDLLIELKKRREEDRKEVAR